jgi:hypothetical protein
MKVVIVNGSARTGKDKFVNFFSKHYKHDCFNWSTIDIVKEYAKKDFGWNGKKTDKARLFLSEIKRIWSDFNDGPFQYMVNKIENNQNSDTNNKNTIYFIHCREPKEIKKFVKKYKNDCITILLEREDRPVPNNNSDKNVKNFNYDVTIENNGNEKDLEKDAILMIEKINKIK